MVNVQEIIRDYMDMGYARNEAVDIAKAILKRLNTQEVITREIKHKNDRTKPFRAVGHKTGKANDWR